jgi:hypothetical protein
MHAKLEQALFDLQRAASAGKSAGESDQDSNSQPPPKFSSQNKLLIGPELTGKLDQFLS